MQITEIINLDLIPVVLRLAVPLTFAAIGGTLSERSGVINIGLEGMMLIGALFGVVGIMFTGQPWVGVLVAVIAGAITGLIHAVLCITFGANQTVSGVGINVLAAGLTTVLAKAVSGQEGATPTVPPLPEITVPVFAQIPIIGELFNKQNFLFYLMIVVVFGSWFMLYKTKYGLRLRAIGDKPLAAATAGVNVIAYRYCFVIISGVLAALGGAYLSIVQTRMFVYDMTAGRGFMALAANIFGGWNPLGSFGASLLFAFAQAIRLNATGSTVPSQLIQITPYLFTLAILITFKNRGRAPQALGEKFENN